MKSIKMNKNIFLLIRNILFESYFSCHFLNISLLSTFDLCVSCFLNLLTTVIFLWELNAFFPFQIAAHICLKKTFCLWLLTVYCSSLKKNYSYKKYIINPLTVKLIPSTELQLSLRYLNHLNSYIFQI